jgi:hypothetical protein
LVSILVCLQKSARLCYERKRVWRPWRFASFF